MEERRQSDDRDEKKHVSHVESVHFLIQPFEVRLFDFLKIPPSQDEYQQYYEKYPPKSDNERDHQRRYEGGDDRYPERSEEQERRQKED